MPFILGSGDLISGYEISNSMRFGGKNGNAVLQKTFSSDGNRKKFTIATWVKVHAGFMYISGTQTSGSNYFQYGFTDDRTLRVFQGDGSLNVETTKTFGDTSGWYHIVLQMDTTQGTNSNRVKFYINGVQETSMASTTWPNQNLDLFFNKDSHAMGVGNRGDADGAFLKGYLADYYFVDNATVAPSTFAETDDNGIWIPKDSADVIDAVTFGTNGFFMNFQQTGTSANSSGMGADTSGNDNHFVSTNTAAYNITTDTPTNSFLVWNPLDTTDTSDLTFSEGLTKVVNATGVCRATLAAASGKWYWEIKQITAVDASNPIQYGIADTEDSPPTHSSLNNALIAYSDNALNTQIKKFADGTASDVAMNGFTSISQNDIIQFAFDADTAKLWVGINGTYLNSGNPANGTGEVASTNAGNFFTPCLEHAGVTYTIESNFGNAPYAISSGNSDGNGYGNFEYAVPSGFYSWNTKNLARFG